VGTTLLYKGVSDTTLDDSNVIILLDKIKKLLELGNKPKAIIELDAVILTLERNIFKKKGRRFQLIAIPVMTKTEESNPMLVRDFELSHKINEILVFLNERYTL